MMHPHTSDEPFRPARSARSSLSIAYAVAKQRAQDLHFHAVMELVDRARGEVAAPQVLSIYTRLHNLSEAESQALKNRVMVHLGQVSNADIQHLPNTFVAIDGAVEWDISASLVDRIRKRVGGRRRHAFREWVELHTGHVEGQLMRLHVECLREVRLAAGPDVRDRDLVRSYAQELRVRDSMLDPLYYGLLAQLFAELPAFDPETKSGSDDGDGADGEATGTRSTRVQPMKRRQA